MPVNARQRNGDGSYAVVDYTWYNRETCGSSHNPAFIVTVLGNPTASGSIDVLVENDQKHPLQLQVLTQQGQLISQQVIAKPAVYEKVRLTLGWAAGAYLLRVTTPAASQSVKVTKF